MPSTSGEGKFHAARFANSARLQRVHAFLADGRQHSTLEITLGAGVVAVGTAVSELRANGAWIECRQHTNPTSGARVWLYRMVRGVPGAEAAA